MRRFIAIIIGLKLWLLLVFATLLYSDQRVAIEPAAIAANATPTPAASDKTTRKTSEPFKGDLSRFEDPDRDKKLQVDRVMDVLGIAEGRSVADIGAGSGWFTVRAARRVGGSGQVFAVDINQDFLDHIAKRAEKEGIANIRTVLGKFDDPKLPADSVDAVLVLKTYHEIAEPVILMKNLRKAVKKGGIVGIIDKTGDGADHGLDTETVVREMKQAGFALKANFDFVKTDGMDYFLVFE